MFGMSCTKMGKLINIYNAENLAVLKLDEKISQEGEFVSAT
jgi:hypothetical protein